MGQIDISNEEIIHQVGKSELVTNERVVLGKQVWLVADIESARLLKHMSLYMVPITRKHLPAFIVFAMAGTLFLLEPFWKSYVPASSCLMMVLLLVACSVLLYTLVRYPKLVYIIRLQLRDGAVKYAKYRWDDSQPAENMLSAISKAISLHQRTKNS